MFIFYFGASFLFKASANLLFFLLHFGEARAALIVFFGFAHRHSKGRNSENNQGEDGGSHHDKS